MSVRAVRAALRVALALFPTSACSTPLRPDVPAALQQEAVTCLGEAVQICPDVWTAEDHGLACMVGKRGRFSPRCQIIYDKVARFLRTSTAPVGPPHGRAKFSAHHEVR